MLIGSRHVTSSGQEVPEEYRDAVCRFNTAGELKELVDQVSKDPRVKKLMDGPSS